MTNHVLYRFFSSTGQLLYIGITMNPPNRFKAHQSDKNWWTLVAGITVENYSSRAELAAAEKRAISVERPAYNKTHNRQSPVLHHSRITPQKITYLCVVCNEPIRPGEGYIQVDCGLIDQYRKKMTELYNLQRSQGGIIRGDQVPLHRPAPWGSFHRLCDPFPDNDDHWYDIARVDTWQKLVATTAHLLQKRWLRYTDWDKFLYRQLVKSGFGYDGFIQKGA